MLTFGNFKKFAVTGEVVPIEYALLTVYMCSSEVEWVGAACSYTVAAFAPAA